MDADRNKERNQKTVLVAEDDEFNFFVLKSLLSKLRYKVFHARDGKEAVDLFRSGITIGLILMDIQMPVMDGFSATREIRKLDSEVPVIAQTAYVIDRVREKALKSGCNDFITKPIMRNVLFNKVEKYLR